MEEARLFSLLHSTVKPNQLKQIYAALVKKQLDPTLLFSRIASNPSTIRHAHHLFDMMSQPDPVLLNTYLLSCSKLSLHREVIKSLFSAQRRTEILHGMIPPVLKACTSINAAKEGSQLHSYILVHGYCSYAYIQTALIDFYVKTGDMLSARKLFDEIPNKDPILTNCLITGFSKLGNLVEARKLFDKMPTRTASTWNSMIASYTRIGNFKEALKLFEQMQSEKFTPTAFTVVTVLSLCAKAGDLQRGLRIRDLIEASNVRKDIFVRTALMEMYAKCGAIDEARSEFDRIKNKDVIAWSAMIAGYAQNGRPNDALELFQRMKARYCKPDEVTLVSILSACAQIGSVDIGENIGKYVENQRNPYSLHVGSSLVDMYAKCGNINRARMVFDKIPQKDVVTWNSMIRALALNGFAIDAISFFERMKEQGFKPNNITLLAVLTACTHAGLVDLGLRIFKSIRLEYNIEPQIEHCSSIVDLFCKAGRVEDAYKFISEMKIKPNVVIWGALLNASRACSNIELAEIAAEQVLVLEPENSSNYVLLSNIYADAGEWNKARGIRDLMKKRNVQKLAAYSWIELDGVVHKFLVRDTYHSKKEEIYDMADLLGLHLEWDSFDTGLDLKMFNDR
ncbi:hypothetical protein LUZ63_013584 [Rhynchospora breviuscula]|uniref:Pentatricopeptide repeat-containing protein n=1 Tax=Rhynchospora breviuscula TaxID=2022672 RepID=A0A9Q0HKQ5_9POAL|nr:hypothetical protein LUZ63_013584 [Rhynchospora breviuscula]